MVNNPGAPALPVNAIYFFGVAFEANHFARLGAWLDT